MMTASAGAPFGKVGAEAQISEIEDLLRDPVQRSDFAIQDVAPAGVKDHLASAQQELSERVVDDVKCIRPTTKR